MNPTPSMKFPLAKFNRWLKRQKPNRAFNFWDTKGCLFCSFAKEALGFKTPEFKTVSRFRNGIVSERRSFAIPAKLSNASASHHNHLTIENFRAAL